MFKNWKYLDLFMTENIWIDSRLLLPYVFQ